MLGRRYRLERRIGSGGFGVVYAGEDTRVQRRVAVKILSSLIASRPDAIERFQREASAAGRIEHEGVAAVTDFDLDEDGTAFLVMEYVEGESLSRLLAGEAPLAPARALAIAARMAQAFAAAHAEGVVHRDLKPANVLITSVGGVEDFVKIVDFGVSKILGDDGEAETLTGNGQVVGTPRYMSPEQGMGCRDVDGRADVYSLGVILYEMLTGHPPFAGKSVYEAVHLKLTRDPIPPSALAPDRSIPVELDELVLCALAREPDRRFASMSSFDSALRAVLEKLDPEAAARVRPTDPPADPSGDAAGPSVVTEYLVAHDTPVSAELASIPSPAPAPPPIEPPAPPRRRAPVWAAACLLIATGAGALFATTSGASGAEPTARPASNTNAIDGPAAPESPPTSRRPVPTVRAPSYEAGPSRLPPSAGDELQPTPEAAPKPPDTAPPPRRPKPPRPRPKLPDSPL